jgi:hypothetical protein
MLAGLHVPVIPSFDVNGNVGGIEFWQSGPMALNVGVTGELTCKTIILDTSKPPAQGPLADTIQLMASLLAKLLPLYVGLFVPTF